MFKSAIKSTLKNRFPRLWVRYVGYRRGYAEPELKLLPQIVPKDLVSVDIGANIGEYTLRLSELSHEVHAFEPAAEMANILRKAVPANVTVHELALSDKSGAGTLSTPTQDGHHTYGLSSLEPRDGDDFLRANVRTARLDDIALSNIGFVKIDVEGHELNVLRGAKRTIAIDRPIFLVECEERYNPGGVSALSEFFNDVGYEGRFLYMNRMRAMNEFDPEKHQGDDA
jgi:FkbM family methyltransferase